MAGIKIQQLAFLLLIPALIACGSPGNIGNISKDLSYISDTDSLLALTDEGLVGMQLNGGAKTLLVSRKQFPPHNNMYIQDWNTEMSAFILIYANGEERGLLVRLKPQLLVRKVAAGAASFVGGLFSRKGKFAAVLTVESVGETSKYRRRLVIIDVATGKRTTKDLDSESPESLSGWIGDSGVIVQQHFLEQGVNKDVCTLISVPGMHKSPIACPEPLFHTAKETTRSNCSSVGTLDISSTVSTNNGVGANSVRPTDAEDAPLNSELIFTYKNAVTIRPPEGKARVLALVENFDPGLGFDTDSRQEPGLNRPFFSRSCNYVIFEFNNKFFVAETKVHGKVSLLTAAKELYPFP